MNIYVLSALSTYITAIDTVRSKLKIRGIIGLSEREANDSISGYYFYKEYCKSHDLDFHEVESYALASESDQSMLTNLEIDYLLVLGWQRLIPEWLIKHCNECAIGAHGSSEGITMGRGRSPQNWALILGKPYFYISIFKIDAGIDSGEVIDTRKFAYNEFDTIATSYLKVSWLTGEMIADSLQQGTLTGAVISEEQHGDPRYLPQRKPEDGAIDWNRTTINIHNFIRGLSQPYPGAWTTTEDDIRLVVWRASPFSFTSERRDFKPGEVVQTFHTNEFVIKTGDGYLLVQEWDIDKDQASRISQSTILKSEPYTTQIQRIVDRHYSKYPDLIISEDITSLLP